ncbi:MULTISPECIES: hypothetical protein [Sphingomonas]|jgi:hypothetical protein|uniref:hypothetical protein n=1 Tax=Sphingomonas TaxID=13687 RepID=UPI00193C2420|nr:MULTISPECIES: hypothetical protein [Sphingomonas]
MTRRPPHRAVVAAAIALAIGAVGFHRPGIAALDRPAAGRIGASFHPPIVNVHVTLEIRP